jgi:hypothetical protein
MHRKVRPIKIEGNIALIPLTQGYEAVIDAADVDIAAPHNWTADIKRKADGSIRTVYAMRNEPKPGGGQKMLWLHRVIAETPSDLETDHIDGDGLNNRRANLRHATKAQNACNRRLASNSTSGAKGVSLHKATGRWAAYIYANRQRKHLGLFDTLDEAATAYANASAETHGGFGRPCVGWHKGPILRIGETP